MAGIAVNGLGRMGKLFLRAWRAKGRLDATVLLNDRSGAAADHAHLLEFDTVHGRWRADIRHEGRDIIVDGHNIPVLAADRPEALPVAEFGADLVVDCTGAFGTAAAVEPYFTAGASKVLVSAPIGDVGALNIVWGVNQHLYRPARHRLVTAASCTTNCLAPVVKVLHEGIGIRHGTITTVHSATNTQTITDRPHKDLRRARSALNALIPTTTGSATAIGLIYPDLAGRLNGHAIRVPLLNASLTDCVFEMARPTADGEVNDLFRAASEGALAGILGYEERPLVSSDYLDDPRSAIVDGPSTMVVGGTQVKVYAWYDNEWGYACRLADVAEMIVEGLEDR